MCRLRAFLEIYKKLKTVIIFGEENWSGIKEKLFTEYSFIWIVLTIYILHFQKQMPDLKKYNKK